MRTILLVAALLLSPPPLAKELAGLAFLLGDWRAEGGGTPGAAAGDFGFAVGLQGRIVTRTSFASYPASADKPAYRHDDFMVIYALEGALRADYYDNEGHVIRYAGSATSQALVLTSEPSSGAPRFRLSYRLVSDAKLEGRF